MAWSKHLRILGVLAARRVRACTHQFAAEFAEVRASTHPTRRSKHLRILGMLAVLASTLALAAEPKAEPRADAPPPAEAKRASKGQYLRINKDEAGRPLTLQTAIVPFKPGKPSVAGPSVDLVAAVHIAEKSYYQDLNKAFQDYDVVLYELVAPEGTQIPKGGGKGTGSPVSAVQKVMKDILQLEFQLEAIDYTAKNFVHADMSPDEFSKAMKNRGDSLWAMFFRMMGYAMARQGQGGDQPNELDLLMALLDKNRSIALKRVLAEQMEDMEGSLLALEGPDGSTLISGRNQKALEVLAQQIDAGKRRIAIFYGAGHMPDLQSRLQTKFGLVAGKARWLTAWNLKAEAPPRPKK